MKKYRRYMIGIDEAGRGPLAGPVSIAAVSVMSRLSLDRLLRSNLGAERFDLGFGPLHDSKKLSVKKREQWFEWLKQKQKSGELQFAVSLVSEKIIDRIGIVRAVRLGIKRCLDRLNLKPEHCRVLLDGSLRVPKIYQNQKTIIRGDEKIPLIMLASIIAKVTRDRKMIRLAKIFPQYGFEIHKGYGTRAHYRALHRYGLSPLHRRSFLKNFRPRY
ncbi:MAG: ribonuclease HII [Candidatus Vogelbacteria bacterium]